MWYYTFACKSLVMLCYCLLGWSLLFYSYRDITLMRNCGKNHINLTRTREAQMEGGTERQMTFYYYWLKKKKKVGGGGSQEIRYHVFNKKRWASDSSTRLALKTMQHFSPLDGDVSQVREAEVRGNIRNLLSHQWVIWLWLHFLKFKNNAWLGPTSNTQHQQQTNKNNFSLYSLIHLTNLTRYLWHIFMWPGKEVV